MTDDLFDFYNRELTHLRGHAVQFAEAHPKVAGRLRLSSDGSEDPHVERLLEGMAYLTAGVRKQLADGHASLAEQLLASIYPQLVAPVPSATVVQFALDDAQADLTVGMTVPRGHGLESEPVGGIPCRFRTAYETVVWPIEVRAAELRSAPYTAPEVGVAGVTAVLRVTLASRSKSVPLSALRMQTLRFFLNAAGRVASSLLDTLFRHTVAVAFATRPNDPEAVVRDANVLRPVGFESEDGLYELPRRSLSAYRLLTEYFAFPRKFHFVDVSIPAEALARCGKELELFCYLTRFPDELQPTVSAGTFALGCTPAVNSFHMRAEPIRVTEEVTDYRVIPDVRRPLGHEILGIEKVTATTSSGEARELHPLFSARHGVGERELFWHARRAPSAAGATREGATDTGTEVFLSVVTATGARVSPDGWVLHAEVSCGNRDLPARLPFGGGRPRLQPAQGVAAKARCLLAPTPTIRPQHGPEALWRLVSHLTLNHLSLEDGGAAATLRELLSLYDLADRPDTRAAISGLVELRTERVTAILNGCLIRGVAVEATFDEDRYAGADLFVFASVLDQFVARTTSVNTFTRFLARTTPARQEYYKWPTRTGGRAIL